MTKTLYPFINKHTGDVQTLTKSAGKKLNEDWAMGKVTKNQEGVDVFRFEIAAPITDKNGKTRMGVAVVDISEIKTEVIDDGNGNTK